MRGTTIHAPISTAGAALALLLPSCGEVGGNTELLPDVEQKTASLTSAWALRDKFGRTLNTTGVTLVDWEGHLANPAVQLSILPPSSISFPATATVSANNARLYFGRVAQVGPSGPSQTLSFATSGSTQPIYLSIWPDHDTLSETHQLQISGGGITTTITIRVVDQDRGTAPTFPVTVDFSEDVRGFFDTAKRQLFQELANDWAYFLDGAQLDPVAANTQPTWILKTDFITPDWKIVHNTFPYTGFLLYAYGIRNNTTDIGLIRSGGEPSNFDFFQSRGGVIIPGNLRRSGGVEMEMAGNYNTLGWYVKVSDSDWWTRENLGHEVNDLASIGHHEMGHALFFNSGYQKFKDFQNLGFVNDPAVQAYYGGNLIVTPSSFDHLPNAIDPASLLGAFGNEYADNGLMPRRRWAITKLDLLVAQAVGYRLRQTSAFVPLTVTDATLVNGVLGQRYSDTLAGVGGVPTYNWTLASGSLPPGLSLSSFSGAITGTPTARGTFSFTVRLRDIGTLATSVTKATRIVIN